MKYEKLPAASRLAISTDEVSILFKLTHPYHLPCFIVFLGSLPVGFDTLDALNLNILLGSYDGLQSLSPIKDGSMFYL